MTPLSRQSAGFCTHATTLNPPTLGSLRALATSLLLFVFLCAFWGVVLVIGLASFQ